MRLGPSFVIGAIAVDFVALLSFAEVPAEVEELNEHRQQRGISAFRDLGTSAATATTKASGGSEASQQERSDDDEPGAAGPLLRRAYVTLLYSDFIEGTRALGQSLRESGTTADTVVLVTPDVRQETRDRLAQDGWIVRPVAVEPNPNQNFQSRLVFVYTKLLIVEMEDEYDRVVFMDADTLVLENIDELFDCEPFCAVMRHSELLNSGVIVITPSMQLFKHMHELIGELDSYTGGDQGFLNSFYPYFAACPAFEPYPVVGSRLPGPSHGALQLGGDGDGSPKARGGSGRALQHEVLDVIAGSEKEQSRATDDMGAAAGTLVAVGAGEERRELADKGGESELSEQWGCKRLPTRYNGDWPLLFVDGDLQVVQGIEAGPEAPTDWRRRKKVKILHFTFGTAKPWNWWAYPFLPYVDLWLEAFYRVEAGRGGGSARRLGGGGGGRRHDSRRTPGSDRRPRWSGVASQALWGLSPLAAVAALWTIPEKALNAKSLCGSIFNLAVALVLALSAAIIGFRAVPAARLGVSRPEAAWAFFWGRATALVVLSEGLYMVLITLKAHQIFAAPASLGIGAPYASLHGLEQRVAGNTSSSNNDDDDDDGSSTPILASQQGGGVGETAAIPPSSAGGGGVDGTGKHMGGSRGVACGARRTELMETLAHLTSLTVMAVSIVSAPLGAGLNGTPASSEVVPGVVRLLVLLVMFTLAAVRLPPLWAARARSIGTRNRAATTCSSRVCSGIDNNGGGGTTTGARRRFYG